MNVTIGRRFHGGAGTLSRSHRHFGSGKTPAQLPFNGLPQVLQQVKAVRYLSRLRCTSARTPVHRDHPSRLTISTSGCCSSPAVMSFGAFPQYVYNLSPLQFNEQSFRSSGPAANSNHLCRPPAVRAYSEWRRHASRSGRLCRHFAGCQGDAVIFQPDVLRSRDPAAGPTHWLDGSSWREEARSSPAALEALSSTMRASTSPSCQMNLEPDCEALNGEILQPANISALARG
jgi:hypothetical protein